MFYIGTVRFSNETFQENKKWREDNNWDGCVYGSPIPIAKSPYWRRVDMGAKIFILEMNNDENKIEGIGCIKNFIRYDLSDKIYEDNNYNRYIYRSSNRMDRKDIKDDVLIFLENIVFRGKGHLKRSHGISIIPIIWKKKGFNFPDKMLIKSVMEELKNGNNPQNIIRKYRTLMMELNICFQRINDQPNIR